MAFYGKIMSRNDKIHVHSNIGLIRSESFYTIIILQDVSYVHKKDE